MIVVKNRVLLIPEAERYIGTPYDNNSEIRTFQIERAGSNGVDLSALSFRLDLQYKSGKKDTALLTKEVTEEKIFLNWGITNSILQEPGTIYINIRATDTAGGVKWTSFQAAVYVEHDINTPGEQGSGLTELEQLEARLDKKMEQMDTWADSIDGQETERQENEQVRQNQETERQKNEIEREKKTQEVINTFEAAIGEAKDAAKLSESWAVGGTGTRDGEDGDNSKYYCEQSQAEADRAKIEADKAAVYADIVPPVFRINWDTMELIQETQAKGIEFFLTENKELGFEYTNESPGPEEVTDKWQIEKNRQDITVLFEKNTALVAKLVNINGEIFRLRNYVTSSVLPTSWKHIVNAIKYGLHKEMYAVGDKLTNIWSDPNNSMKEYDNPLRINHFQDGVELENGEPINGMWLQTQYAQLKAVQFSHQRAFLRCPEGLAPGTYYFTIESNWGNNVKAGDVVCFTTAQAVPANGKISGCYGAPDQTKDKWRIYTHSADGKEIIETITPTFEASGIDLGVQKSNKRNGNLNSTQEMAYGWNRWKTSAIRQYLNSDKPKGEWWTAQDEWDIAPDQLKQIDGYLKGVDSELLAVIQPVKVTTYANTVNDGGVTDTTYDKVILPSLEQMYIKPQIQGEGETQQYYRELNGTEEPYAQYGAFPELITYAIENHASAQSLRLRSAYRGYAYSAWYVSTSGYVNSTYASSANRFAPLVFIGASSISAPTDAE